MGTQLPHGKGHSNLPPQIFGACLSLLCRSRGFCTVVITTYNLPYACCTNAGRPASVNRGPRSPISATAEHFVNVLLSRPRLQCSVLVSFIISATLNLSGVLEPFNCVPHRSHEFRRTVTFDFWRYTDTLTYLLSYVLTYLLTYDVESSVPAWVYWSAVRC